MADDNIINAATLLKDKLKMHRSSAKSFIFKIPRHLLEVNEKAYRPRLVSTGPIHYQEPHLQAMEDVKLEHLKWFLEATKVRCSLEDLLGFMTNFESEARSYYTEEVSLSSNEFISMLLVDVAFVISHLTWCRLIWKRADDILNIRRDLLLEDNQLPYFVLEEIYNNAFGGDNQQQSFREVAFCFVVSCYEPLISDPSLEMKNFIDRADVAALGRGDIQHLVDLLWLWLKPSNISRPSILDEQSYYKSIEYAGLRSRISVTNLKAAGVKFEVKKSLNRLDVTFDDGVVRIPKIVVHEKTESLFRSILAFERRHHYSDSHFNDYMYFLDSLINTPEDIQVLVESGIIRHYFGSDAEVAELFNTITRGTALVDAHYYYADVTYRLNEHAYKRGNRWKVILKNNYFSHPWAAISFFGAITIFILTLLQTIGTFKAN